MAAFSMEPQMPFSFGPKNDTNAPAASTLHMHDTKAGTNRKWEY